MCSTCFPRPSLSTDASLSSTGSSRASSPASTVLSKRYDFLLPVSPHYVSFAWRYLGVTRCVRSLADECTAKAWSWSPGVSSRDVAEEATGSPKFLFIMLPLSQSVRVLPPRQRSHASKTFSIVRSRFWSRQQDQGYCLRWQERSRQQVLSRQNWPLPDKPPAWLQAVSACLVHLSGA